MIPKSHTHSSMWFYTELLSLSVLSHDLIIATACEYNTLFSPYRKRRLCINFCEFQSVFVLYITFIFLILAIFQTSWNFGNYVFLVSMVMYDNSPIFNMYNSVSMNIWVNVFIFFYLSTICIPINYHLAITIRYYFHVSTYATLWECSNLSPK